MKNAKTKDIFESDQADTDGIDEKRKTTYMYILQSLSMIVLRVY